MDSVGLMYLLHTCTKYVLVLSEGKQEPLRANIRQQKRHEAASTHSIVSVLGSVEVCLPA